MSPAEKDALFAHLLRSREVFEAGKEHLKPEVFDRKVDALYLVAWKAVCGVVEKHGIDMVFAVGSKPRFYIETEAASILHANPDLLTDEQVEQLLGDSPNALFRYIYDELKEEVLDRNAAFHWLRKFLTEAVQREASAAIKRHENHVFVDMPGLLDGIQKRYAQVQSVGQALSDQLFPEDWEPEKLDIRSTGIPFLDQFMRGGRVAGEVYGILGCYGAGKTTLAIQMTYRGALKDQELFDSGVDKELGWWYLFHYEAPKKEILQRLLSHAADIPRSIVEDHDREFSPFSTSEDPSSYKQYELDRYKLQFQMGELPPGEKERKKAALQRINRNVMAVDMTGMPGADGISRGSGYVPEIAQILSSEVAKKRRIAGVIIDYVGVSSRRYLAAKNGRSEDLRHLVGGFPDAALQRIALPFNCHVWLFHQVTAASNNLSPTTVLNHTHSAEGRNFGENVWYSFVLNREDPQTGCRTFTCSKTRRSSAADGMPQLLTIDPCGTLKVSDKYMMMNGFAVPKMGSTDVSEYTANSYTDQNSFNDGAFEADIDSISEINDDTLGDENGPTA